jgi:chromosomal replication initiation ATPase DnaA
MGTPPRARRGRVVSQTAVTSSAILETASRVLSAICVKYDVTHDDLTGLTRNRLIVRARQEAMWVLWESVGLSLPEIGWLLHRDHTTVLHAIDKRRGDYAGKY